VQIARLHSKGSSAPDEGVKQDLSLHKSETAESAGDVTWSSDVIEFMADRGLLRREIPVALNPVAEDDVPQWLWRQSANHARPASRREETAADAVRRIAGGWTYQGWKSGYFDSEQDARAFFDEIGWLLLNRRIAPEPLVWRHEGVYWAYGMGEAPTGAIVDYRTGGMRQTTEDDIPPHESSATGPGDDSVISINAKDEDAEAILLRHGARNALDELRDAGRLLAGRHLSAIVDACRSAGKRLAFDPDGNPSLRLAIASARGALIPETLIDRVMRLVRDGNEFAIEQLLGGSPEERNPASPAIVVEADDRFLADVACNIARDASGVLSSDGAVVDALALAAWSGVTAGMNFSDANRDCLLSDDDGTVRRVTLNLPAFVTSTGLDTNALRHAAMLAALASDIALAKSASATPRQSRQSWDFRPIAISPSGVAPALMAMGFAYDSKDGRETAAAICGLVTGAAWAMSASIAEEMGACPGWERNAAGMLRNISAGKIAALAVENAVEPALAEVCNKAWEQALDSGERSRYRNAQVSVVTAFEPENRILECDAPGLEPEYSLLRYDRTPGGGYERTVKPHVVQGLKRLGYDGGRLGAILRHMLGNATLKGAPGINHENLRNRGFTEEALRVLEAGLAHCPDISFVFSPWALGEKFCTQMLGLSAKEFEKDEFDLLSALGYSEAAIEAANNFCCGWGTLEGAPGLDPAHLTVFDCATPQGERSRRRLRADSLLKMMAAVQPAISGNINHRVTLTGDSTVSDCRAVLIDAWRMGLKSIVIVKEAPADSLLPKAAPVRPPDTDRRETGWTVIEGGYGDSGQEEASHSAPLAGDETAIARPAAPQGATGDASPSPGSLSEPARSSASSGPTRDAATEQRHL